MPKAESGGKKALPRPSFTFLICPDSQLLRSHLQALLKERENELHGWKRHTFWGDEDPDKDFWEALCLDGLLASGRVVLVRQAQHWQASVWKKISHALARPSAALWAFFCLEGEWEKGKPKIPAHLLKSPLMLYAQKQGWIWENPGLNERSIRNYLATRARALNLQLASEIEEAICNGVAPHALAIENELARIKLIAGDGPVSLSILGAASYSPASDVFALLRQVRAGNLVAAWREIVRESDPAKLFFSFLSLMARDLRQLWLLLHGEEVRLHPSEASEKRSLAKRLGLERIALAFAKLANAEAAVKSGQNSPDQALHLLVADLSALFSPRGRQGGAGNFG